MYIKLRKKTELRCNWLEDSTSSRAIPSVKNNDCANHTPKNVEKLTMYINGNNTLIINKSVISASVRVSEVSSITVTLQLIKEIKIPYQ